MEQSFVKGVGIITLGGLFSLTYYSFWTIGLMVLFPFCWTQLPTRKQAFLFTFSYYLSLNWEEIPTGFAFFEEKSGTLVLWISHALLMSLPWVLFFPTNKSWPHRLFGITTINTLLLLPPLGYFFWGTPFTAAGIFFPGTGEVGLFLTWLLMGCIQKKKGLLFLISFSALTNVGYQEPTPPKNWVGINTHLGKPEAHLWNLPARQSALIGLAKEYFQKGYNVLLFPENIAQDWLPGTRKQWESTSECSGTVLLGVQEKLQQGGYNNSLAVLGKEGPALYAARQPMPFGLWKPWDKESFRAHWGNDGTFFLRGKKVLLLICYEQMVPWPLFSACLWKKKPDVIVNPTNQWFGSKSGYTKQKNFFFPNARLFGLPYLTATNF